MGEVGASGPLEEKRVLRGIFCHGCYVGGEQDVVRRFKDCG